LCIIKKKLLEGKNLSKIKKVYLNDIVFGGEKLIIIAGPCVIEDDETIVFKTAEKLKEITKKLGISFIFKASYDKANRSSINSYRGVGLEKGLEILAKVKKDYNLPILTDVHLIEDIKSVAEVADILQIPAFLCRQTDLLVEAAKSGKIINIKKGQFLAPDQMNNSANKVIQSGNNNVIITERGSTFGYGNLVSDMRSIPIIHELGFPVIFDATHSVQLPGGAGTSSSGERKFVSTLAKSAVAAGCDSLFFEVHPDPDNAPCDGPNMIKLDEAYDLFKVCRDIFGIVKNND
jgi:2-dehydro-3-deoxyphosphooctonate aldolase (KDO 8-P synthase)